jgi:hypothetical protein
MFHIVVAGVLAPNVLRWLQDALGTDCVVQDPAHVRIAVADQAAMVGALNGINDLGLEIRLVERRPDGAMSR